MAKKDEQKDPPHAFISSACGIIGAECHALLGLINPGDQISDT